MTMSEIKTTMTFGGTALLLGLLALGTVPGRSAPDAFFDIGEPFFPEFTDPSVATTLEVIEFDEATAAAMPFKVTNQDGLWTIPSHHDYPADGEDRLAQTAAGVVDIIKDDFRSDNVADHEALGVIDPLDETVSTLTGRGKRVTVKDETETVLADFIIGNAVGEGGNLRFVRVPGQNRVYAARMEIDISTRFEDWIEKDLLQVERGRIDQIILNDYSINERTLSVTQRGTLVLENTEGEWNGRDIASSEEVDVGEVGLLLAALDDLSIVGVRPKPAGVSQDLTRITQSTTMTQSEFLSLQSKGYYLTRDGRLLSNEGELLVRTSDGIGYTLRFGEIVYGTGEAVTAGGDASDDAESGPGENRYLFITAQLDMSVFPEPPRPQNTNFEDKEESEWSDADRANKARQDEYAAWEARLSDGRAAAAALATRFTKWYYVISSDSFGRLHLQRQDLVRPSRSNGARNSA